ncbi:hypothetical protein Tco_1304437 [Tanacetum coccineum]
MTRGRSKGLHHSNREQDYRSEGSLRGYFKDGDGDGNSLLLRCQSKLNRNADMTDTCYDARKDLIKGIKDFRKLLMSCIHSKCTKDGNPLQDDGRICLGDDLKKPRFICQRQA